jgi:hypothetical protein
VDDSENFGARIAKIGIAVAKIRRKEVLRTYLEFLEVTRAIFGIIFENQGVFIKICGPRIDFTERQGANCKMVGIFPPRIYFSIENSWWTRSAIHGPLGVLVHDGVQPWSAEGFPGARPSGCSNA